MGKAMDLTGEKYGRLTVIGLDEEKTKEKKKKYWLCKCECGNIKSVEHSNLRNGTTKSCGCLRKEILKEDKFQDLTGMKFKMLEVIKVDEERNKTIREKGQRNTYWICKCDCGNFKSVEAYNLKNGKVISCGCYLTKIRYENFNDLKNKRYGRLIARERVYIKEEDTYKWKCECDCGNTTYVTLSNLKTNTNPTRSCGCLLNDILHERKNDITNQTFGMLTVVGEDDERSTTLKRCLICKCECGNVTSVSYANLISGTTKSCGCLRREMHSGSNSHMWKGGITPLSRYLREHIQEWKVASLKNTNYKCLITNTNKDLVIHHIYPFNKILKETLEELDMPIKEVISEYSKDELNRIESKFLENHFKYGYGAVITKELHIEFHSIYGNGNYDSKSPEFEEWDEFYNNKIIC